MTKNPRLAITDGNLQNLQSRAPSLAQHAEATVGVHTRPNVLERPPKAVQPRTTTLIRSVYQTSTKESTVPAPDHFRESCRAECAKAVERLDRKRYTIPG